jgi:predicted O-linked N-acetylglucosamine transferase (SPINDLY family)
LARHAAADLFLDCFPCSAHTTASDALFAGLPLITLIGDTFASRVAASLLTSVGLSELIANNLEEYEEKALFFTRNTDLSETLKYALRQTINYTALYNTANFARSFEDCLLEVYRRERPS